MPTMDDVIFRFVGTNDLSGMLNQLQAEFGQVGGAAEQAALSGSQMEQALKGLGIAAVGVAILAAEYMVLAGAVEAAAEAQDRQIRFTIAEGGAVGDTKKTIAEWGPTIDQVVADTGRGKGAIMTLATQFAIAGITSKESMKGILESTTSLAFVAGKTPEEVGGALSKMITSGVIMNRTLSQYGLSVEALGVTTEQFKAMTVDERTAVINAGVAKRYGSEANQAYKDSFAGMMDKISQSWAKAQVALGSAILPIVLPILDAIGKGLMWVAVGFSKLPPIVIIVGAALVALTGIALTIVGLMIAAGPIMGFLAAEMGVSATMTGLLGGALNMLIPGLTATIAQMGATSVSGTYLGVTMTGTSFSFMAFAGSVWTATSAVLTFLATTPIGWLILLGIALVAVITYFGWWGPLIDGIKNVLSGLWGILKQVAGAVAGFIMNFTPIGWVIKLIMSLKAGWDAFMKTAAGKSVMAGWVWLLTAVGHGFTIIWGAISAVGSAISGFIGWVAKSLGITDSLGKGFDYVGAVVWVLTGVFGALTGVAHFLLSVFQGIYSGIATLVGWFQKGGGGAKGFGNIMGALQRVFIFLKPGIDLVGKALKLFMDIVSALARLAAIALQKLWGVFQKDIMKIWFLMNFMWVFIQVVWAQIAALFARAMVILQPFISAFQALYAQVAGALGQVWAVISSILGQIGSAFMNVVGVVVGAISKIVTAIINDLGHAIDVLRQFICPIIGCSPGIIPAFKEMGNVVPREISKILPHLNKLKMGLPNANIAFGGVGAGAGGGAGKGSASFTSTGASTVHHHNETITIDASHLTDAQLERMLIRIYERG